MKNHNTKNQTGPQTQSEKRGQGRPRGSGRGARRAQTQRPAATKEQAPDIVPLAPEPVWDHPKLLLSEASIPPSPDSPE